MPIVLYAEDDMEHRLMMRTALKGQNVTLIEAVNGQHALEKVEDQPPDLILLDLFMPKMDGFGVMKALKSNPETSHIPIIILSAWPTGDNRRRAAEAGAIDFVTKPYDPIQLIELVKEHVAAQNPSDLPKSVMGQSHILGRPDRTDLA